MLITNGKGQNQELAEAIINKFSGTTLHKWRVFGISPQKFQKAEHTFIVDLPEKGAALPSPTLEKLHKEFSDFTYEADSVIDLSSDVSQGAP